MFCFFLFVDGMKIVLLQQIQHQTDDDDDDDDDCSHIYHIIISLYSQNLSKDLYFFMFMSFKNHPIQNVTLALHRRQEYSKQVKANANSLAEALKSKGAKKKNRRKERGIFDFFAGEKLLFSHLFNGNENT